MQNINLKKIKLHISPVKRNRSIIVLYDKIHVQIHLSPSILSHVL